MTEEANRWPCQRCVQWSYNRETCTNCGATIRLLDMNEMLTLGEGVLEGVAQSILRHQHDPFSDLGPGDDDAPPKDADGPSKKRP